MEELVCSTEENDDEEEVMVPEPPTTKMLAEVLQISKALADRVFVIDLFMERRMKCKRALEAAMLSL